jgi:hypothetical protein
MSQSAFRSAVCCLLAIVFPGQMMLAGETPSAMLYTNGPAWLNGSDVPKSAAVFSGDLLQTRADSTASIQSNGSSVMVLTDSLVKFEGSAVKPGGEAWTEFQVTDVDGRVQIAANKGDLTVQDGQGTTTVSQGQQTTRDDTSDTEKKKKHRRGNGAATAATGGIMSSTPVVIGGLAAIGGVGVWLLTRSGAPISPTCPTSTSCQE